MWWTCSANVLQDSGRSLSSCAAPRRARVHDLTYQLESLAFCQLLVFKKKGFFATCNVSRTPWLDLASTFNQDNHGLLWVLGAFVSELKLRTTSSAEKNFADEITWITWKTEQNLEIWLFCNSLLKMWVWESGQKIDPATGVRRCKEEHMITNVTAEVIERKWDQGGRLRTTFQDPPKV